MPYCISENGRYTTVTVTNINMFFPGNCLGNLSIYGRTITHRMVKLNTPTCFTTDILLGTYGVHTGSKRATIVFYYLYTCIEICYQFIGTIVKRKCGLSYNVFQIKSQ